MFGLLIDVCIVWFSVVFVLVLSDVKLRFVVGSMV